MCRNEIKMNLLPLPYNKRGEPIWGSTPIGDEAVAQLLNEGSGPTVEEITARLALLKVAPNQRAFQKKELVLPYIFAHGIVDATVLCTVDAQMTHRTAQQTLSHYEAKGWIARVDLPGVPPKVYRLTPAGARWVSENAPSKYTELVKPWVKDSDIPKKEAEHKLLIQLSTHHVRHHVLPKVIGDAFSPKLVRVKPERILRALNEKLVIAHKFPDAVVSHEYTRITADGEDLTPIRIAIEAQESAELADTTERIITMYLEELRAGTIDYVVWTSTKGAVASQYHPQNLNALRCEFHYNPEQMKWFRRMDVDQFGRRFRKMKDFSDVIDRILTPIDLSEFRGRYYRT